MALNRFVTVLVSVAALAGCDTSRDIAPDPRELAERTLYAGQGRAVASMLAQNLLARLLHEIDEAGPAGAVEFCSAEALAYIAMIAETQGVELKRTSSPESRQRA